MAFRVMIAGSFYKKEGFGGFKSERIYEDGDGNLYHHSSLLWFGKSVPIVTLRTVILKIPYKKSATFLEKYSDRIPKDVFLLPLPIPRIKELELLGSKYPKIWEFVTKNEYYASWRKKWNNRNVPREYRAPAISVRVPDIKFKRYASGTSIHYNGTATISGVFTEWWNKNIKPLISAENPVVLPFDVRLKRRAESGRYLFDRIEGDSMNFSSGVCKCPVDKSEIRVGDVVSYQAPTKMTQYTILHRVVRVCSDGIIVKGDNNEKIDPYVVPWRLIIGKMETG